MEKELNVKELAMALQCQYEEEFDNTTNDLELSALVQTRASSNFNVDERTARQIADEVLQLYSEV